MNYNTLHKNFQKFIDHDDHCLTEEEQQKALKAFEKPINNRVFQMSIVLLLWSLIGMTIDSFIIGGSVVTALVMGPAWIQVLPTLIFSGLNWLLKWIFVYFYMQREIPWYIAFMTGVQYIGFTFVLGYVLKNDPEFKHGLQHYVKHLKKKGIRFVFQSLQKSKNTS